MHTALTPTHRKIFSLAIVALCATLSGLVSHISVAQTHDASGDANITANFQNADIQEIINAISEISKKTFIIDPRVKAQITMISATPMTPDAFYAAFLSILEVYGFVAVEVGNVVKVVPDTNARQMPMVDYSSDEKFPDDEMTTHIVQLRNVSAAQLVPILRPLIPQYGHLAAHPSSNILIISDRAANVDRMLKIIARIDQASDADIEVIPLHYASAADLAQVLTSMNQVAGGETPASPVSVIADDRTNSLIIGGDTSVRLRFRALIAHLDTPLEEGENTQVVYLRYADAEELATKLKEQITQDSQTATATAKRTSVWADKATNALVITAPPKSMRSIRSVIDQLDIRRAQVQIEAIIADLSDSSASSLGVVWAVDGSESDQVVGGINFPGSGLDVNPAFDLLTTGDTSNLPALPDGATFAIGHIEDGGTSFGAIINALAGDGTTNILSQPTIVTMDNEEAELSVGQEVPFLTGQFTDTGSSGGSSVNPFQTIQREDVGLKLTITPQINEGNAVILEVNLEVSSLSDSAISAVDLITNRRTIRQKVVVEDGGTIVLGGLIDENLREKNQRVPFLGRIPILGYLFKAQSATRDRNNLMVFLRPTILRDGTQASIATNSKYRYIRDQQLGRGRPIYLLPGKKRPLLPELEEPESFPPIASMSNSDGITQTPDKTPDAAMESDMPASFEAELEADQPWW